ncbi:lipopolysaccharide biosynthesis protein [Gordonia sputi]
MASTQRFQDVTGGAGTLLLANLIAPIAAFISSPILARVLGVDGRGEVAAATAPFLLVVAVATLGLPESTTYHISASRWPHRKVLAVSLASTIFPAIVSMTGTFWIRGWVSAGSETVAQAITVSTLAIFPALSANVARGAAAALGKWKLVLIERVVTSLVRLMAFIFLAVIGSLTVYSAAVCILVSVCVGIVAYVPLTLSSARSDNTPQVKTRAIARPVLSYGGWIWLGSISGYLLSRLDQTLINPLAGAYALGLYAAAVNISEVPLVVNSSIRDVLFAHFSREPSDVHMSARISSLSTQIVGVCCFVVGICAYPMLKYLFGDEFVPALLPTIVLLVGVVVGNPGSIAGVALSGIGKPKLRSLSLLVASVLNVAVLLLLVPRGGAVGAAAATLAGNFVAGNLNIVFLAMSASVRFSEFYRVYPQDYQVVLKLLRSRFVRSGAKT